VAPVTTSIALQNAVERKLVQKRREDLWTFARNACRASPLEFAGTESRPRFGQMKARGSADLALFRGTR